MKAHVLEKSSFSVNDLKCSQPLRDGSILVLSIPLEETNRQDVSHADNHHRKLASES